MKKLICILSCLLLIASTIISASAEYLTNIIDPNDYFTDKSYNGDVITLNYSFPFDAYSEFYAYRASDGASLMVYSSDGNTIKFPNLSDTGYTTHFSQIRFTIYPLGRNMSDFNCIDVSDIKSGSSLVLNMSFEADFIEYSLKEFAAPNIYVYWLDENFEQVSFKGYTNTDEDFVQISNEDGYRTYRFDKDFVADKPSGAKYFYIVLYTGWIKLFEGYQASAQFNLNDFIMSCDISAFEENSQAMQQIQNSIDSGFSDVNNNLNDIENVIKDDPNHTPDTSPLKDDLNDLEDLEGEIDDMINQPVELPDGSDLEVDQNALIELKDWWKDYYDAPEYESFAGRLYAKIFESFMPYLGVPIFFSLLLGLIIAFLTGKRSV